MYLPKVYNKQGGDVLVIADGGQLVKNRTVSTIATAGAGTYLAAHLVGGLIARDCAGGARTDTTDTAANILAALDLDTDGDTFECYVVNTSDAAEAITIAGGTGVTIANAGQTLAQNESAILVFVRTAATTLTAYIIGA